MFFINKTPSQAKRQTNTQNGTPNEIKGNHQYSGLVHASVIVAIRLKAHNKPSIQKRISVALRVLSFLKQYLPPIKIADKIMSAKIFILSPTLRL